MRIRLIQIPSIIHPIISNIQKYCIRFTLNHCEIKLFFSWFKLRGVIELREFIFSIGHDQLSIPIFVNSPCIHVISCQCKLIASWEYHFFCFEVIFWQNDLILRGPRVSNSLNYVFWSDNDYCVFWNVRIIFIVYSPIKLQYVICKESPVSAKVLSVVNFLVNLTLGRVIKILAICVNWCKCSVSFKRMECKLMNLSAIVERFETYSTIFR